MSLVNDITSVKKAVTDNWDDIISTADQLETIIAQLLQDLESGIFTVQFSNTQLSDLNINNLLTNLQTNEAAITTKLDPVLEQIQLLFQNEVVEIDQIINFIEDTVKSFVTMPEWNGVDLDAIKNVLKEIANEGFSVATVALPKIINIPNSTQSSVSNTSATPTASNQSTTNTNSNTNAPTGNSSPTSRPTFTDVQDGLLAGLEQHFMLTINKYEKSIEEIIADFQSLIPDNVVSDLETMIRSEAINLSQQPLTTAKFTRQIGLLTSIPSITPQNLLPILFTTITNNIEKLSQIFSDLLSTQPMDDNADISALYMDITNTQIPPTPLKVLCLLMAIPTSVTSNGIFNKGVEFDSIVFHGNSTDNNIVGAFDIVSAIANCIKLTLNYRTCYHRANAEFWLKVMDLVTALCEIPNIISSRPRDNSDYTALPINTSVWITKLCTRLVIPLVKILSELLENMLIKPEKEDQVCLTVPMLEFGLMKKMEVELGSLKASTLVTGLKNTLEGQLWQWTNTSIVSIKDRLLNWCNLFEKPSIIPITCSTDNEKLSFINNNVILNFAQYENDIIQYRKRFNNDIVYFKNVSNAINAIINNTHYQKLVEYSNNIRQQAANQNITAGADKLKVIRTTQKRFLIFNGLILPVVSAVGECYVAAQYFIYYQGRVLSPSEAVDVGAVSRFVKNPRLAANSFFDFFPEIFNQLKDIGISFRILWTYDNIGIEAYKKDIAKGNLISGVVASVSKFIVGIISLTMDSVVITNIEVETALYPSSQSVIITFNDIVRDATNMPISSTNSFRIIPNQNITSIVSTNGDTKLALKFNSTISKGTYTLSLIYNRVYDQYGFPVSAKQEKSTFTI